jgi:BirA family biotin operon repressor/biotin-[acetyl-CoA-carboxylase] ligase
MTGLSAEQLAAKLDGCRLARRIVVHEEITSTSDAVVAAARDGAAEGLVVFAETQTAGRGRLGRKWESASRKGLWFSLLLRPNFSRESWTRLTTWAAVAVAEAIEEFVSCRVSVKWPNDLQIDGKKIAGILIETGTDTVGANFAVVGIGVNANHDAGDFSPELSAIASSLRMASGHEVDRMPLAAAILRRLDGLHSKLQSRFHEIVAEASKRSSLIGKNIQIHNGGELIEGIAERLDENGALMLRRSDGSAFTAASGEATLASAA